MKFRHVVVSLLMIGAAYTSDICYSQSANKAINNAPIERNNTTNSLETILNSSSNTNAAALYKKYRIFIEKKGSLESSYDLVRQFSTEYELISKLAECLIDSKLSLRKQPDKSYLYNNGEDETSKLWVVYDHVSTNRFSGVYYFTGERFFSNFEALLHLESRPNSEGGIDFDGKIYADSESRIFRLMSKLSFVKSYFSSQATEVATRFDDVYREMTKDPEGNLKKIMNHRDPKGKIYFSDDEIERIIKFYNAVKDKK